VAGTLLESAQFTGTRLLADRLTFKRLLQLTFGETGSGGLGVARITLLRTREAGRIRLFSIGTLVV